MKVLSCRFHKALGPLKMLNFERCSKTGIFRHWSNQVICILQFWKYISYKGHLVFENV